MKHNIIYNSLYQIVNLIIPIITSPYLARVIGAEGVGISAYTKAVAGYFLLFAMLGVNNYGNRTIASLNSKGVDVSKCFWEIYSVQFMTSVASMLIYCIYCMYSSIIIYQKALIINSIYVLSSIFDINWFYYGMGEFKFTSIRNIAIKIISTIGVFCFVKSKSEIELYVFIVACGYLLSNLILWINLRKYIKLVPISFKESIRHIKPIFVLFIPVIAVSIYKLMDKIMLGNLTDISQSGYYENASNIITMPLAVITAMGTVMLPRISGLVELGEHKKIKIYNRDSIRLMMALCIPFTFGVICVADTFVPWFFGEEFYECIRILQILSLTCPFIALGNVIRTQCLIPYREDYIYVKATIMGALINFIINITLIPKIGAVGAALGTVGAEIIVSLYQYIKGKKYLIGIPIFKDSFIFVCASFFMSIVVNWMEHFWAKTIILLVAQVVIGICVYMGIVFFICVFLMKEELYIGWRY